MSFPDIQARMTASLTRHMSNADIVIGQNNFRGFFRRKYVGALDHGVETTGPSCEIKDEFAAGLLHNTSITVNGSSYKITGIEPGDDGFTVLRLRT